MIIQKYVHFRKDRTNLWLTGPGASDSYLASQCSGNSGLENDLEAGWIVRFCWEDSWMIIFLLEKK